jgi:hypothetical protein
MSEFPVPDCLVLKIEEYDVDTKELDTTLYILYDKKYHNYVVRGRRRFTPNHHSCEYSFVCEDVHDLLYFITFVISKNNLWTYVLYNYDNLSIESDEITFEFLYNYDHSDYELAAYDKMKYNRRSLINNLRMLRNVFNFYN